MFWFIAYALFCTFMCCRWRLKGGHDIVLPEFVASLLLGWVLYPAILLNDLLESDFVVWKSKK